jgi:toxin secretion/phage lysis holin
MGEIKEAINVGISIICTSFIFLFGKLDIGLKCLICAIVIDYITGIFKAYYNKELSSEIGFKGAIKKFAMLFIVVLSVQADRLMGDSGMLRNLVIYYLFANEGLSILENLGKCGLPIPDSLKNRLKQLKEDNKEEK